MSHGSCPHSYLLPLQVGHVSHVLNIFFLFTPQKSGSSIICRRKAQYPAASARWCETNKERERTHVGGWIAALRASPAPQPFIMRRWCVKLFQKCRVAAFIKRRWLSYFARVVAFCPCERSAFIYKLVPLRGFAECYTAVTTKNRGRARTQ